MHLCLRHVTVNIDSTMLDLMKHLQLHVYVSIVTWIYLILLKHCVTSMLWMQPAAPPTVHVFLMTEVCTHGARGAMAD